MKKKAEPLVKEKKCPECKSLKVGMKGSSTTMLGRGTKIRLEFYECGTEFYISKSDYKP